VIYHRSRRHKSTGTMTYDAPTRMRHYGQQGAAPAPRRATTMPLSRFMGGVCTGRVCSSLSGSINYGCGTNSVIKQSVTARRDAHWCNATTPSTTSDVCVSRRDI